MGIQIQPSIFLFGKGKYYYFMSLFKVLKPQAFLWLILLKLFCAMVLLVINWPL
jgi:hypothetical protein